MGQNIQNFAYVIYGRPLMWCLPESLGADETVWAATHAVPGAAILDFEYFLSRSISRLILQLQAWNRYVSIVLIASYMLVYVVSVFKAIFMSKNVKKCDWLGLCGVNVMERLETVRG